MNELNLEQPTTESNVEFNFETEDDLLDAIRQEAEKLQNNSLDADDNGESVPTEPESNVDEDTPIADPNEANEDNNESKPDEEFDVAKWLSDGELERAIPLKNKGLTVEIKKVDEARKLMEKGLDYTRKTQELAEVRKVADYAAEHNISMDDLRLFAEYKAGNKAAIAEMARRSNIESMYDIDMETEYKPNANTMVREYSEADLVAQEIAQDDVLLGKVKDALTYVPNTVADKIVNDATLLSALRDDVSNGIASAVLPEATKLHSIYGGDFFQHYINVANRMFASQAETVQPQVDVKPSNPSAESKSKAAISSVGSNTGSSEVDIWDPRLSQDEMMDAIRRQASLLKG